MPEEVGAVSATGAAAAAAVSATGCTAPGQRNIDQRIQQLQRHSKRQDIRQQCCQSQQLMQPLPWAVSAAQTQQSLMQGLQMRMQPGHRHFATSPCSHKRQSGSGSGSVPLHHQPSKHVQGTDPLRLLKAANAAAGASAGGAGAAATARQTVAETAQQAAAAALQSAETVSEPWHVSFQGGAQIWLSRAMGSALHVAIFLLTCFTALYACKCSACTSRRLLCVGPR